ncbi:hypothetical protein ACKWTF_015086 [Chironomus riparius]
MADRAPLLSSNSEIRNIQVDQIDSSSEQTQRIVNYGSIQEQNTSQSSDLSDDSMPDDKTTLKFFEKLGFSLGHVYNDLCAGIWFSYTLLFMQGVLNMPGPEAGAMVMLGQVGDAIATPIVGMLTDKFSTKRKWHIFGTFLVILTFPLIFSICPFCDVMPTWWHLIYFTIVILIFQFAWPVVQISHLAMIPEISRTQRDRSELTATRYSASICSNVVVYIVTWAVLHLQTSTESKITPADWPKFRDIALILTLIGVSMSVLFHFSLSLSNYEFRRRLTMRARMPAVPSRSSETESLITNTSADDPPSSTSAIVENGSLPQVAAIPKKNFFRSPLLYQNALLYVFSRLFMTTSLVYMPLWLNERAYVPTSVTTASPIGLADLPDNKSIENIATVPLASFVASFLASMFFKMSDRFVGHKVGYLIGSVISVFGCAWVALAATPNSSVWELYAVATFFGAGSSVTMIASLCITADMIGPHADQGGFIYSAVTFCDKLITGIAVVVIETVKCKTHDECPTYYRDVLAYACGVSAILGIVTLTTLTCTKSINERIEREERRALRT